jgi:hypothetical protein
MIGSSDSNRSQKARRRPRGFTRERSLRQRRDRRNTNRQRGRVRAISVLTNAKSNRHRKTHQVEPDGTSRKFMHLTRGDLLRESAGEVSRGHSSKESRLKTAGAKGQRTTERAPATGLRSAGEKASEIRRALQLRQPPTGAPCSSAVGLRCGQGERGPSLQSRAKGGGRRCSMK